MTLDIQIEGWDEFVRQVESLASDRVKRRVILKVLRRAAKPMLMAAKSRVPVKEEKLKKSLGLITGKSLDYPNIQIGARVKRGFEGFHAHLVENGTGPRRKANGQYTGSMPARPFMRPAYTQTRRPSEVLAVDGVARYIQKVIDKTIK